MTSTKGNISKESCRVNKLRSKQFIQPKLTIGPVNDRYEQEADQVAEQVVQLKERSDFFFKPVINPIRTIQRKCAACEKEEEESVQRKESGNSEAKSNVDSLVADAIESGGSPMDDATRSSMESNFGYDFSRVKIHTNSVAAKSADALNAHAYTTNNNIVFNQGTYQPQTIQGKKLLAHELTHVVQQTGKVQRACDTSKPDIKDPKDLGPEYNKNENEILNKGNLQKGRIKNVSQGSFFLYNIHNEAGCDTIESLIEGSVFYLINKGPYYSQVWAKQSKAPEGIFVWGYADNRFLDFTTPKEEKKNEEQPATVPEIDDSGFESHLPESLEDLNGFDMYEMESYLYNLTSPEIISIMTEAELKDLLSVVDGVNNVIKYKIDDNNLSDSVDALENAVADSHWDAAVRLLADLSASEIMLVTSQWSSMQRGLVRDEAFISNPEIVSPIEAVDSLMHEVKVDVQQEAYADEFRKAFGKDWNKAAESLNKFEMEIIYLELQQVSDFENLRKLRKAADQIGAVNVSLAVSSIIAGQEKMDVYIENTAGNKWSENFMLGLLDGGLDITLGDAWESFSKDISTLSGGAQFIVGYNIGVPAGILKDLYHNVEGVAEILLLLAKYQIEIYIKPQEVLKEVGELLKGLFKLFVSAMDAREFGYIAGRALSAKISKDFTNQSSFSKGWEIGEIIGMLATEIALLFVGVGEVTAVMKGLRTTKIFIEIESALKKSETLGKLVKSVQELKLGKLAEVAGLASKEAKVLKSGSAIEDMVKAEEVLADLAKLEARDGGLITKQMQPLERAILEEKVKTPSNIKPVDAAFEAEYMAQVKIGEHTYRIKPDGTWCRFSERICGIEFSEDTVSKVLNVVSNTPVPSQAASLINRLKIPRVMYFRSQPVRPLDRKLLEMARELRATQAGVTEEAFDTINIAVARVRKSDGTIVYLDAGNLPGGPHSEQYLVSQYDDLIKRLGDEGSGARVEQLYSERVPCINCQTYLEKYFLDADVFYTVGNIKNRGRALMRAYGL